MMMNPLDLNNLPDDYPTRDPKHVFEAASSKAAAAGRYKKKKSGATDGKDDDECGKVYECRFCSLKFCKSQALGGHMNRHRQERETEILNHARQLVFNNQGHLGYVYPQRFFSSSPSTIMPLPPPRSFLHPSPPHYITHCPKGYNVRCVLGCSSPSRYPRNRNYPTTAPDTNYTCIGAPVGHVFGRGVIRGADLGDSAGGGGGAVG